ncbi:MAG: efflux RND transporter periplasmic adaptor subunit, partial [Phycisphaerales bacterium JB064]
MADAGRAGASTGETSGPTVRPGRRRVIASLGVVGVCVLLLGALGGLAWVRSGGEAGGGPRGGAQAAAVEVAAVEVGRLEGRRAYSATLDARALVTIAPKVAGTITSLPVDLGDIVEKGQVLARLDGDEFAQAAAQAEAELEVVRAQQAEAQSAAEIAARELDRTVNLHNRGIASDAQLDQARAAELTARSAVAVVQAQLSRARAALQAAQIRLGYATIRADWEGGNDTRVIARRWAEEGDTVGANTPILSVVELDPITAVFYATQRDYGRLKIGQAVGVMADAFPGESWTGEISRIAPVFDEASRQARVEVRVPNAELRLKPGMFVRAEVVLEVAEGATIVP